jgi:hypothetical protein
MSSTTPNPAGKNQSSKPTTDLNQSASSNPQQDTLGEDDEFEDFPVESEHFHPPPSHSFSSLRNLTS